MKRFRSSTDTVAVSRGGFGLLELLIALSILAVGTLGIMKLQMQSGFGNADSRCQSAATNLARSKMEELKRLNSYTVQEGVKPDLEDPETGGSNDLGNWTPPDHTEGPVNESREDEDMGAKIYTVMWNVVDDLPIDDFKTVRIRVSWQQLGRNRFVELESQIGRKDIDYF